MNFASMYQIIDLYRNCKECSRGVFAGCLFFSLIFFSIHAAAQTENKRSLVIHVLFSDSLIKSGSAYYKINKQDSIQFETLKFYISSIEFLNEEKVIWEEKNSFHLIDIDQLSSLTIELNTPTALSYTNLKFNLGIDSLTNVSGAMGGDLDPTKGMYWTWQNGYINLKLEGKCSLSPSRQKEFTFHIGGYQFPFNTQRTVNLKVSQKGKINLVFDVSELINEIDFTKQSHLMSPCTDAVFISQQAASAFKIKP